MLSYILAAALLVGDPDETHHVDPELFHLVNFAAQQIALEWEIIDPREVRWVLTRSEDFHSDLRMLRNRNRDLWDAPSAADALRFPDRASINELLSFNRGYRQHVDVAMAGFPHRYWEFKAVLQETDHLYKVWDLVRDARCEYYYITVQRRALKDLRELIGMEAYYRGNLPPHVPLWRFQQIR